MMVTRRWFYVIPAQGEPSRLVHRIESHHLDSLPGSKERVLLVAGTAREPEAHARALQKSRDAVFAE